MSYAGSAALQEAIYARLIADAALAAEVGNAIYDVPPSGTLPAIYVLLGDESVRDRSDITAPGALHRFTVQVIASASGFAAAKRAAAAVSDALMGAPLGLTTGTLVGFWFERARASRLTTGERSIALRFSARVDYS